MVKGKKECLLGREKHVFVTGGGDGLRCAGFEAALVLMCFAAVLAKSATTVLRRAGAHSWASSRVRATSASSSK